MSILQFRSTALHRAPSPTCPPAAESQGKLQVTRAVRRSYHTRRRKRLRRARLRSRACCQTHPHPRCRRPHGLPAAAAARRHRVHRAMSPPPRSYAESARWVTHPWSPCARGRRRRTGGSGSGRPRQRWTCGCGLRGGGCGGTRPSAERSGRARARPRHAPVPAMCSVTLHTWQSLTWPPTPRAEAANE